MENMKIMVVVLSLVVFIGHIAQARLEVMEQHALPSGSNVPAAAGSNQAPELSVRDSLQRAKMIGDIQGVKKQLRSKLDDRFKELLGLEVSKKYLNAQKSYENALLNQQNKRTKYQAEYNKLTDLQKKEIQALQLKFDRDPSMRATLLDALNKVKLKDEWLNKSGAEVAVEKAAVNKSSAYDALGSNKTAMDSYQTNIRAIDQAADARDAELRSKNAKP